MLKFLFKNHQEYQEGICLTKSLTSVNEKVHVLNNQINEFIIGSENISEYVIQPKANSGIHIKKEYLERMMPNCEVLYPFYEEDPFERYVYELEASSYSIPKTHRDLLSILKDLNIKIRGERSFENLLRIRTILSKIYQSISHITKYNNKLIRKFKTNLFKVYYDLRNSIRNMICYHFKNLTGFADDDNNSLSTQAAEKIIIHLQNKILWRLEKKAISFASYKK